LPSRLHVKKARAQESELEQTSERFKRLEQEIDAALDGMLRGTGADKVASPSG
jgi:hypothetical protein